METREKRRNIREKTKGVKEKNYKNRRKINIVGWLVTLTIVMIVSVYGPRAIELYNRHKKDDMKAPGDNSEIYPLEIKLEDQQILEINDMLVNYFKGIKKDVDATDGFSNKEMIEFGLNILSEKYSSSGIVPPISMDTTISRYFGKDKIDYIAEGYKDLKIKESKNEENEGSKETTIHILANIKKIEKDLEMYELEVYEILKSTIEKSEYKEKDIISKKKLILEKIVIKDYEAEAKEQQDKNNRYVFVKSNI